MSERNAADIEASRKRLSIPDGYQWSECEAECGDVAWHPPMDVLVLQAAGKPILLVCSAACATAALKNRSE